MKRPCILTCIVSQNKRCSIFLGPYPFMIHYPYPSPQAAQKLMGGMTGDQVDGFFKLRTFQKPSQERAEGSTTTVLPNKKPQGTRKVAPTLFNTVIPCSFKKIPKTTGVGVPHMLR